MSETGAPAVGRDFRAWVAQSLLLADRHADILLAAYLCRQHVLLEGPPGVGKTTLARLVGALVGDFGRIQMTADLTPSDILGFEVYNPAEPGQTSFRRGPVFHRVLLVDEINRAMPRCQSALLQAMEERAVDIAGQRIPLPADFFVVATQNPLDLDGTFVLPQSQLDRFGLAIRMSAPAGEELERIVRFGVEKMAGPAAPPAAPALPVGEPWRDMPVDGEWYRVMRGLQDFFTAQRARGCLPASPRAWNAWLDLARCLSWLRGLPHLSTACLEELLPRVFLHRMDPLAGEGLEQALVDAMRGLTGRR